MDLILYIMIAFWGSVPPLALGIIMYQLGQKQGDRRVKQTKQEIRDYVKGELLTDIKAAVAESVKGISIEDIKNAINGALGIVGKRGSDEAKALAIEYAQQNPQIAGLVAATAGRTAARTAAKSMGIPKDIADGIFALLSNRPGRSQRDPSVQSMTLPPDTQIRG